MSKTANQTNGDGAKPVRIVILQAGFVAVGRYEQVAEDCIVLTRSSMIRKWGTTRGLGQIAKDGPTANTVLDPCGTMRFHPLVVIATLDCEDEPWRQHA